MYSVPDRCMRHVQPHAARTERRVPALSKDPPFRPTVQPATPLEWPATPDNTGFRDARYAAGTPLTWAEMSIPMCICVTASMCRRRTHDVRLMHVKREMA